MLFADIFLFAIFALLLVMSPGPNGLLIARSVSLSGKSRAHSNILGFVCAFYFHGVISVLGLSALLLSSANAFLVFKLLGASYLLYIGVKSLVSVFRSSEISQVSEPSYNKQDIDKNYSKIASFSEGFLTNALNPKVSLFYLAAFPQFISHSSSVVYWSFCLITLHAVLNAIWFLLVTHLVDKTKELINGVKIKRWLSAFTGIVFIGFALKLATTKHSA
jgi:threonine/homoserine/homoserine lactone efflux protein